MTNHNKKRNIGLVYEFFARYIGQAVIDNKTDDIAKAKKLLKKHFGSGSELHKELKAFKAIYENRSTSRESAIYLLNRVKDVVASQDQRILDSEKSSLILEINGTLRDQQFFNRPVADYKTFANIQVAFNLWRSQNLHESISETVSVEEKIIEHLLGKNRPLNESNVGVLDMQVSDINKLVVGIMTEKVNRRFSDELNDEQKLLIRNYVFKDSSEEYSTRLTESLTQIKSRVGKLLEQSIAEFQKDKLVIQKLNEVRDMLGTVYADVTNPNDDLVGFYLSLPKLESELKNVG